MSSSFWEDVGSGRCFISDTFGDLAPRFSGQLVKLFKVLLESGNMLSNRFESYQSNE